jgi:ABC-type dipeptide/oligopeptide/nickel transport system permease subunit
MKIQPLILWSDALIYLLIIGIIFFIFYARRQQQLRDAWQQILKNKLALFSLAILFFYISIGFLDSIHFKISNDNQVQKVQSLFDIIVSPLGEHDEKTYSAPFAKHLYAKELIFLPDGKKIQGYPPLKYPYHVLGTDKIGEDVLYETLKSIRTGLIIGTLTTLVMLPFAIFLGMLAGYFRGFVDDVIQYVYTTLSSIPDVLLIAAAILALQIFLLNHPSLFSSLIQRADLRLIALCVILGITSWTGLCRLLRGETLKLREQDYVQASIALGTSRHQILLRHILPNLMHLIVIAVVMDFSGLVLAEAVLTYVGVGVDPSTIGWGNMINAARLELAREPIVWWPLFAAFLFMFPLIISANLFADGVRDALDPRIRKL